MRRGREALRGRPEKAAGFRLEFRRKGWWLDELGEEGFVDRSLVAAVADYLRRWMCGDPGAVSPESLKRGAGFGLKA